MKAPAPKSYFMIHWDWRTKTYQRIQDNVDPVPANRYDKVEEVIKIIMQYWDYLEEPEQLNISITGKTSTDTSSIRELYLDVKDALEDHLTDSQRPIFLDFYAYEQTQKTIAVKYNIVYTATKNLLEGMLIGVAEYLVEERGWKIIFPQ